MWILVWAGEWPASLHQARSGWSTDALAALLLLTPYAVLLGTAALHCVAARRCYCSAIVVASSPTAVLRLLQPTSHTPHCHQDEQRETQHKTTHLMYNFISKETSAHRNLSPRRAEGG